MGFFTGFLFGPFASVILLIGVGGALVYFFLGIQNLYTGIKEKNSTKINSAYLSVFISFAIGALIFFYGIFQSGNSYFGSK
jgi:uncharacterized protein with PQ loop repeat